MRLLITRLLWATLIFTTISCQKSDSHESTILKTGKKQKLGTRVIYGEDDRKDLSQVKNPAHLEIARSTLALVEKRKVHPREDGNFGLSLTHFGNSYGLCPEEPFREQSTLAFCSGSLVGPDLVITAGHCISDQVDCDNTLLIFDFAIASGVETPSMALGQNVYACKQVIASEAIGSGRDYAVIRLDRAVTDRQPLAFRDQGRIKAGDSLVVIGHPSGLPTKVADQASVRRVENEYFVANLDTYGGNSGSAVFNASTLEIEGILVRGEMDFKYKNNCRVSNRCEETGCRGEDVTRIEMASRHFPKNADGSYLYGKKQTAKKRIERLEADKKSPLRKNLAQTQKTMAPWKSVIWTPIQKLKEMIEAELFSEQKDSKEKSKNSTPAKGKNAAKNSLENSAD